MPLLSSESGVEAWSLAAPQGVPHGRLFALCLSGFGLLGRCVRGPEERVKGGTGAGRKAGVARLGHGSEHIVELCPHSLGKGRVSACFCGQQHSEGRFDGHGSGLHLEERCSDQTAEIGKRGATYERLPCPGGRIRGRIQTVGFSLFRGLSVRRKVGGDCVLHRIISHWQI